MAACCGGKEEPLSTLRITYEALVERNKLLMSESPVDTGLLYLVPTTDQPQKEKQNWSKKKSGPEEARLMTPQQRLDRSMQEKTPSRRRSKSNQECRGSNGHLRTSGAGWNHRGEPTKTWSTEQEDLIGGWSRHENRRIERALSRWSGDPAKLNPMIVMW